MIQTSRWRSQVECITLAVTWLIVLVFTVIVHAGPVVVTDTFTAGTVGNGVVFEVRNNTNQLVSGVKMTPQFPLQYSHITKISPQIAELKPGESIDFIIEFSIHKDVPNGASDSITLFFDNNENIMMENPRYQINIDIIGDNKKANKDENGDNEKDMSKYKGAYFVVKIEGSGFSPTYSSGTYKISGSETRFIWVPRGTSAIDVLKANKKIIDGDRCDRSWAAPPG